jgi:flagellar hook assembly protein FlgD
MPPFCNIRVYNIAGYKVFKAEKASGRLEWNGTNMEGEKLAPGIYYYIIEAPGKKYTGKLYFTK